jgi:hypothetical protein
VGVLGLVCWALAGHRLPVAQYSSSAGTDGCAFCYPWNSGFPGFCLCRGPGFPDISGWMITGPVAVGSMELWVSMCAGSRTYSQVQSNRDWLCTETSGIGDQECWAASCLPMVSCFSISGFRGCFASHWLWDHMGVFWGPQSSFFRVFSCCWGLGMSTISHLAQDGPCILMRKNQLI